MPLNRREREPEARLAQARRRLDRAYAALRPRHGDNEREEARAAHRAMLDLERELAAARGEPHAVPVDFPIEWDIGAPLPHLLCSDYRTFLTFYARVPDPDWDGTYVTIKSPGSGEAERLALVEFRHCMAVRMGCPNDEVQHGHPLYGRGLDGYTAQQVVNSPWLAELEAINRVHRQYRPELWRGLHHYVLWFHDTTFECIAEGFTVEVFEETMAQLLSRICERLLR